MNLKKRTFTEAELRRIARHLQKLLRLQDWDVKVKITRKEAMEEGGSQGECHWCLPNRQALIRILDPVDWPDTEWDQDHLETLVHELLHIHFAPFAAEHGTPQATAQEQAIDSIAYCIAKLLRNAKGSS